MKISIIMPIYNVENYLEEALKSLNEQNFSDYEVIMVDDGSTDNSSVICQRFVDVDSRFKYFWQENQGQSVARNLGLSNASGDIIYFFDSDDLLRFDSLHSWALAFKNADVKAILFEAETFTDDESIDFLPKYIRKTNGTKIILSDDYLLQSLKNKCYTPSPCCYVVRRTELVGMSFYPGIIHEDELFYFELFAAKSIKILVQEEAYFKRRVRPGSTMTASNLSKRVLGYSKVIEKCLLVQKNLRYKELNSQLNHFLASIFSLIVKDRILKNYLCLDFNSRMLLTKLYLKLFGVCPFDFILTVKILFPEFFLFIWRLRR